MNEANPIKTKTIGILGGMGPAATADLYRRIVEATYATRDQDHLHVLIDSYPGVPDRTEFLLGSGKDPTPTLIAMAHALEQSGAKLLIIPCNTANAFVSEISAAIRVPLLNWVNEVSTGVVAHHPSLKRLGLLATTGTVFSGLYQQALAPYDINVIVPDQQMQEKVMAAIYGPEGVKAGNIDSSTARKAVELAGGYLQEVGAEVILIACTELSLLFASHSPDWSLPTLDAAQLVAERVVILAGGRLKK